MPLHRKRERSLHVPYSVLIVFPHFASTRPHCSFQVSIRGRILRGTVVSNKMQRSVILRRDYLHYIKKYNRYEKRHKNFAAHVSPCFKVSVGDGVIAGQCRCVVFCP